MNQQEHDEMKMMMGEDKEIWAKIEGHEGYEISTYGRVRSFWRGRRPSTLVSLGKVLCAGSNKSGYCNIMFKGRKNKNVHRLVAETFISNLEYLPVVDHIDGNKLNNHISNLRWTNISNNRLNSKIDVDNTSGFKGVFFENQKNAWRASWYVHGEARRSNYFKTKEEAIEHRKKMVEQHYDLDFYKDG